MQPAHSRKQRSNDYGKTKMCKTWVESLVVQVGLVSRSYFTNHTTCNITTKGLSSAHTSTHEKLRYLLMTKMHRPKSPPASHALTSHLNIALFDTRTFYMHKTTCLWTIAPQTQHSNKADTSTCTCVMNNNDNQGTKILGMLE
eukprot:m.64465 g.64465  ORF g.64465 m.64465 type:complete len:143 (+) comp12014_c0_seq4:4463-4891(+)